MISVRTRRIGRGRSRADAYAIFAKIDDIRKRMTKNFKRQEKVNAQRIYTSSPKHAVSTACLGT